MHEPRGSASPSVPEVPSSRTSFTGELTSPCSLSLPGEGCGNLSNRPPQWLFSPGACMMWQQVPGKNRHCRGGLLISTAFPAQLQERRAIVEGEAEQHLLLAVLVPPSSGRKVLFTEQFPHADKPAGIQSSASFSHLLPTISLTQLVSRMAPQDAPPSSA